MHHQHKLSLLISILLGLLFALPWVSVSEQFRGFDLRAGKIQMLERILFIFSTVFVSAQAMFYLNFNRKRILGKYANRFTTLVYNLLLILVLTLLTEWAAHFLFGIQFLYAYFVIYLVRNSIIALVVVFILYSLRLIGELQQKKLESLMLQHRNVETELMALKSQMDPHFFFNTLSTLNSLVRNNSGDTVAFIDSMADTFRYMLENRSQAAVTVREELTFLKSYLFMMQKRFDDALRVRIDISPETEDRRLPQFSLQVVVENAIKHNVVAKRSPLTIEVISVQDQIVVRNNLQARDDSTGYGVGLKNLSQRYRLLWNEQISVLREAGYFEVQLPVK